MCLFLTSLTLINNSEPGNHGLKHFYTFWFHCSGEILFIITVLSSECVCIKKHLVRAGESVRAWRWCRCLVVRNAGRLRLNTPDLIWQRGSAQASTLLTLYGKKGECRRRKKKKRRRTQLDRKWHGGEEQRGTQPKKGSGSSAIHGWQSLNLNKQQNLHRNKAQRHRTSARLSKPYKTCTLQNLMFPRETDIYTPGIFT